MKTLIVYIYIFLITSVFVSTTTVEKLHLPEADLFELLMGKGNV